ncbi:class I SAM-dependent methyltransferase [Methanofollis tationis]|uniref:Class I SAM-dependent methyltransferase n=1 Tax=Methanofollis tationis TaxID=81417 RepID=A0A7K4HND2_9EURY|nr:class I SAM-dependent methyltransferase [Methanofollis tationis]NVO66358.1 class I SAM-dependent methyltransferase [Methanofollis tationis]
MNEVRHGEERKAVLSLADVNEKEVLDIGAGPLAIMAVQDYDCFVTSVDLDADKLAEFEGLAADAGVAEKISFEVADASNLPYCDDAFDIGICFGALHHVPAERREQVISELARVSYERFVIAEFTPAGFAELHGGDAFAPVDLAELEHLLKGMGNVSVHQVGKMAVYVFDKTC